MEIPPPYASPPGTGQATAASTAAVDMDAVDTAPLSRSTEPSEADLVPPKMRLMCSYGGQVMLRTQLKVPSYRYVGGLTRIIAVNRSISFSELVQLLSRELLCGDQPVSLKYQLPGVALDTLISVDNEEDFENMVAEYDLAVNDGGGGNICRFRVFLFPKPPSPSENLRSGDESVKLKDSCDVDLNRKSSLSPTYVDPESSSINRLLGLEDNCVIVEEKVVGSQIEAAKIGTNDDSNSVMYNQDLQLISDSPFPETNSDSTSNSTPLNNFPPVGMNSEDNQTIGLSGSEYAGSVVSVSLNVNAPPQIHDENGGSEPSNVVTGSPPVPVVASGETDRNSAIDDMPDNGVQLLALETQQQLLPPLQHKLSDASDSYSPDSDSSEFGIVNPSSIQVKATHQEKSLNQIQPRIIQVLSSNPHETEAMDHYCSQLQEQGYAISSQFDQMNQTPHFVHSIPSQALPFTSYYPVLHPQQQQHSHPTLYYLSSMPCYGEFAPATAELKNAKAPSQQDVSDDIYRTVRFNQVPFGCNQVHHSSQTQMYYAPMAPHIAPQYRTLTSAPAIVVPNAAAAPQLQAEIQSSQPCVVIPEFLQ